MADNFEAIGQQFVHFYYQTFDADRTSLAALYREKSMLTFEKAPFQGVHDIIEKLTTLPFGKVQHRVDTVDAQPNEQGGIVLLVTGALMVDDQQQPMSYVQTFTLLPESGSFYVFNDIFRLVYPAS